MIRPKSSTTSEQERREAEDLALRYGALLSEARRISANVIHGAHGRRRRGSGETFWEFRHARDEDPAHTIDWRRSARSDALFVRETEWEAANTIFLWRDSADGMDWRSNPDLPSKQDRAGVLLAALGIALLKGGERCAVPGVSEKPGSGIGATNRICHDILTGTSVADQLVSTDLRSQAHMVLASDFLEGAEVWKTRLLPIQRMGISVILLHIADPAEEEFPYTGHILFAEPGSADQIDLGRAQLVGPKYRERFAAGREEIRQLARRNNWLFFSHRTDQYPAEVFLSLFQGISNGHAP